MSKKYVAFIIGILTLLMAINCLGEGYSFSFRNGICFGENSDSVMSKEPKIYRDVSDPNILRCDRITLSGINNSYLLYHFEYDKLRLINILYGSSTLEVALKDYDTINEGLIRKYGNPITDIENATIYPQGAISTIRKYGEESEKVSDKVENAINQWVINVDEEKHIIIEHVLLSYNYTKYSEPEPKVQHRLSYQYIEPNSQSTDLIDKDL